MSLERVNELQAMAERESSIAAYDALLDEDMAYLMAQAQRVRAAERRRCAAQQRRASLQSALRALEQQRQHLVHANALCDSRDACRIDANTTDTTHESDAADAMKPALVHTDAAESNRVLPSDVTDAALRARHERDWLRWMTEFATRKEVLTHLLACPAEDLAVVDLTHVAHWLDTWSVFFHEADSSLRALKHQERVYNSHLTVASVTCCSSSSSPATALASAHLPPATDLTTAKNEHVAIIPHTSGRRRSTTNAANSPAPAASSYTFPSSPVHPTQQPHHQQSPVRPLLPPTQVLLDAMDEVCRLQLQARSLVGRERYRRSANCPDAVQDFLQNQHQLMEWCAQQRRTLTAMQSLPELTEFSASLQTNVAVMETNFTILMEQAEALRQNSRVLQALRDTNQAWMDLLMDTYLKLRSAAVSAQEESGLEPQCRRWGNEVATRVSDYLVSTHSYLKFLQRHVASSTSGMHSTPARSADAADSTVSAATMTTNTMSNDRNASAVTVSRVEALLMRNMALLNDVEAFQTLCAHLSDFAERRECVEPHLHTLQQELHSQLAATVLSFPAEVDYKGRLGYRNRMDEMREWIDVRSQKSTYLRLLERLDETKKIIEDYADALFPETVHATDEETAEEHAL